MAKEMLGAPGNSPRPQARWTPGPSCHPDTTQDPLPQTDPQHSTEYECALPWKLGPVVDIHVWGCGIAPRIPCKGCWGSPSSCPSLLESKAQEGKSFPLIPSLGLRGRAQRHEPSSAGRDAAGDPGPLAVAARKPLGSDPFLPEHLEPSLHPVSPWLTG